MERRHDLFAFNPQTRTMYVADRTNHAVTAIDSKTDALIGVLPIPGGGNTNGVLIAPELQQLIVTDGKANRPGIMEVQGFKRCLWRGVAPAGVSVPCAA